MNATLLYFVFVIISLAAAAVIVLVVLTLSSKKTKSVVADSPSSKLEALPYDPIDSPEVNALVDSAMKLWSHEASLDKPGQQMPESEVGSLENEVAFLRQVLAEDDTYYFDPTGQHYSPADYLEVLSVQDGVNMDAYGTSFVVAESPAIVYKDTLIRRARVNIYAK